MSDPEIQAYVDAFAARGPAPRGAGQVRLIVVRRGGGVHEVLDEGTLSVEGGLQGDRWDPGADPARDNQLTLMNARVIETLKGGDLVPDSGDNFLVDLDLCEAALPARARLALGAAVVELTDEPHTGCRRFSSRFGSAALKWINAKGRRPDRLRGVHARVLVPGVVRLGDAVEVLEA